MQNLAQRKATDYWRIYKDGNTQLYDKNVTCEKAAKLLDGISWDRTSLWSTQQ